MNTKLAQLFRKAGRSRFRTTGGGLTSLAKRRLRSEPLESRMMLTTVTGAIYQNPVLPTDVNDDGAVSPLDALIIVNELNANGPHSLVPGGTSFGDTTGTPVSGTTGSGGTTVVDPTAEGEPDIYYLDVNGDDYVSPLDALLVINELNAEGAPGDILVTLQVQDLAGDPVDTVLVGDEFVLVAFVDDARAGDPVPAGLVAAYIDVTFNDGLAQPSDGATIQHSDAYPDLPQGDLTTDGRVNDAGGFTPIGSPAGPDPVELWSLQFTAEAPGSLTFTSEDNDNPLLVFAYEDTLEEAPPGDVVFGNVQLGIDPNDVVIDLQITDAGGTELTEVDAGQEFLLKGFVQDVSGEIAAPGVRSVYMDMTYDDTLVAPVGTDINYTFPYSSNTLPGDFATAGAIGDIGAEVDAADHDILDDTPFEVFSIPFKALDLVRGTAAFEAADDGDPATDIELRATGLPADLIIYDEDAEVDVLLDTVLVSHVVTDINNSNVVTELIAGNDYTLTTFVQDTSAPVQGVGQAYVDITYDETLVGNFHDLVYGAAYDEQLRGDVATTPGLLDNVGGLHGATNTDSINGVPVELFHVSFTAQNAGTLTLASADADVDPAFDVKLDDGTVVAAADVDYGALTLEIKRGEPWAHYWMRAVDPSDGSVITEVESGQSFDLEVFTRDLRDPPEDPEIPRGVFAAYVDVMFDTAELDVQATSVNDLTFGPTFTGTPSGSLATPGLIDDVGAFGESFGQTGPAAPQLLFSARMQVVTVVTTPTDITIDIDQPTLDPVPASLVTALYDIDKEIPTQNLTFEPLTLTLLAAPAGPFANDDVYTVAEDTLLDVVAPGTTSLPLLTANDYGPEGPGSDPLSEVAIVTPPAVGTFLASATKDGSFTYQPPADFSGTVTFIYRGEEPGGDPQTNEATVTIVVTPVNDPPTAVDDAYNDGLEDTPLVVSAADGVLDNDTDPEGDTLTASLATQASNGVVQMQSDGSFTYTPNTNFNGSDSFTYTADDGNGGQDTATVFLSVANTNDAPVAVDNLYQTDVGETLTVPAPGVLGNDSDIDGDPLNAVKVTEPSHGTLSLNPDGSFTYVPEAGYFGRDEFQYRANDGQANSGLATVRLEIGDLSPSTIDGVVFADVNDNGVHDPGERMIGGVEIRLQGTNILSETVDQTITTGADGGFNFGGILAGSYTLTEIQPEFMLDGIDTVTSPHATLLGNDMVGITLTASDELTGFMFGERGLEPEYVSAREDLTTVDDLGMVIALDPLGDLLWYSLHDGWDAFRSVWADMSADRSTLTIEAVDHAGATYRTTVSTDDPYHFRWMGTTGEGSVVRIIGSADDFLLQPLAAAEGEPNDAMQPEAADVLLAARNAGAGYPEAVDALFGAVA